MNNLIFANVALRDFLYSLRTVADAFGNELDRSYLRQKCSQIDADKELISKLDFMDYSQRILAAISPYRGIPQSEIVPHMKAIFKGEPRWLFSGFSGNMNSFLVKGKKEALLLKLEQLKELNAFGVIDPELIDCHSMGQINFKAAPRYFIEPTNQTLLLLDAMDLLTEKYGEQEVAKHIKHSLRIERPPAYDKDVIMTFVAFAMHGVREMNVFHLRPDNNSVTFTFKGGILRNENLGVLFQTYFGNEHSVRVRDVDNFTIEVIVTNQNPNVSEDRIDKAVTELINENYGV